MKIDRLVSIIMTLLEKERIGAQALADMLEVSPRTIYRDIDSISMAGIPVRSAPGVGGGFEIMREYKIDKKAFSAADLSALLMGLSGKICVDLSPWTGDRHIQPYLGMIKTALRDSKLLSFDYADRYGNKTARTAEPYQLVLKSSHWYWQGYCRIRNDFRLFKLARTSNLQMQKESFTPREHQKPQLDATDMLAAMQTTIKIRIHQSVMDRVLDYCAYEHFSPDGGEHYRVSFPFIENEYYYHILFSFGDKCECLEPPHVRAEMKRRIQDMAAIYEN
ncbi:MAG: YafY family transcriptional regulator [Oscillospiraceae bacterium]|nr:YafY family transcriptional regulator [Oscillospiraceae bacterium]